MVLVSRAAIETARQRIAPYLSSTPVIRSHYYSEKLGLEVYFKLEMLQPTHSFKPRGAFNALLALPEAKRQRGVVTASGGNHGLGVSLACAALGIPAKVYLPTGTPQVKITAIERLGAEVILYGEAWDDANRFALEVAKSEDRAYIHPFDDPDVMAGQATVASELLDQIGQVDAIVTSIGGGGLIAGITSAVQHYSPAVRVIGVETAGADCMAQSVRAGQIVELPAITSIAESLGAKRTAERQFQIVSQYVDDVVVVPDEAAIQALVELLKEEKLLVEPATSCCIAALTGGKIALGTAKRVVVILCGANVSLEKVSGWLAAAQRVSA